MIAIKVKNTSPGIYRIGLRPGSAIRVLHTQLWGRVQQVLVQYDIALSGT